MTQQTISNEAKSWMKVEKDFDIGVAKTVTSVKQVATDATFGAANVLTNQAINEAVK